MKAHVKEKRGRSEDVLHKTGNPHAFISNLNLKSPVWTFKRNLRSTWHTDTNNMQQSAVEIPYTGS